jgi:hypothetical protein
MTEQPQPPSSSPSNAFEQQQQAWYKRGSFPMGSCIGGIPIYVHYSFFALMVIMLLSAMIGHSSDPAYWGVIAIVYGPILLVTIVVVSPTSTVALFRTHCIINALSPPPSSSSSVLKTNYSIITCIFLPSSFWNAQHEFSHAMINRRLGKYSSC